MTIGPTRQTAQRRRRALTPERRTASILLAGSTLIALALAYAPDYGRSIVHGPMTPGHEHIACVRCHAVAPGSMRQQAQANVRYWLGLRRTGASFGHEPVTSKPCLDCHARENDRHPIHRFREPRFLLVTRTLDTRSCLSCHAEHRGVRLTVANGEFCQLCHHDLKPRVDPITPSHPQLVAERRWTTCLTCHDFHGNHPVKAPTQLEHAHDAQAIQAYLAAGPDPYSTTKIHGAKRP
ncbi:MAG: hypothetical protein K2X43_18700 [Hyphomonadaceae bacterium]|jgi:hypothetical protein|nr:hypothetical protein [Hyphomonadaceae bacterium]